MLVIIQHRVFGTRFFYISNIMKAPTTTATAMVVVEAELQVVGVDGSVTGPESNVVLRFQKLLATVVEAVVAYLVIHGGIASGAH